MVIPDVNVLLYSYDTGSDRHETCARWLETALNGVEEVGFSFVVLLGFLRISTHPGIWMTPMTTSDAVEILRSWLKRPNAQLLHSSAAYWSTFADVAAESDARGSLLMDAHLAALALEHGATVVTTDRDLHRFRGLRLHDPTA